MQLETTTTVCKDDFISFWRIGEQISGRQWYHLYRAAPKSLSADSDHDFVIKIINPNLNREQVPIAIDRLSREAMATEQIGHPNVMRLLDAELDHAPFFLVQPWIHGRTLDRLFSRAPYLSLSRVLWVMRQIAEGVRAGHEKSRAYLGLDPSHVLISKTGRVTLTGWSYSHRFGEQVLMPPDNHQLAKYSGPETFSSDYTAHGASDIYSLGVLIHQFLAVSAPFEGQTIEEIEQSHLNTIPEDLIVSQPHCPPRLNSLVKQMLAKNPVMRPSIREVLNELIAVEIEHLSDTTPINF